MADDNRPQTPELIRRITVQEGEDLLISYAAYYGACIGLGIVASVWFGSAYAFFGIVLIPVWVLAGFLIQERPFSTLPEVLEQYDERIYNILMLQAERNRLAEKKFLSFALATLQETEPSELAVETRRFLRRRGMAFRAVVFSSLLWLLGSFVLYLILNNPSFSH